MATSLVGRRFGRLEVVAPAERPAHVRGNGTYWACRCACQSVIIVSTSRLTTRGNQPLSCGCIEGSIAHARLPAASQPKADARVEPSQGAAHAGDSHGAGSALGARAELQPQLQLLMVGARRTSEIAHLLLDALNAGARLPASTLASVAEELEDLDHNHATLEQTLATMF
jgi:hypothetical protein